MSYAIIETLRRIVQLIFGSELFDLPILSSLRKVMYRLCFDIGKSPTIGFGMRFFRSHRMKNGTVKVGNNVLLAKHSEIDYSGKVVIGDNVDVFQPKLYADQLNFMSIPDLEGEMRVQAKIRYSHQGAWATIRKIAEDIVECEFDEPQRAITPGQAAVFYDGDHVVGGGSIIGASIPDTYDQKRRTK